MERITDDEKKLLNQESYDRIKKEYYNKLYIMSETKVSFEQDFNLAKDYAKLYKENPSDDLIKSRLIVLRWSLKKFKELKKSKSELEQTKKRVEHTYKKTK